MCNACWKRCEQWNGIYFHFNRWNIAPCVCLMRALYKYLLTHMLETHHVCTIDLQQLAEALYALCEHSFCTWSMNARHSIRIGMRPSLEIMWFDDDFDRQNNIIIKERGNFMVQNRSKPWMKIVRDFHHYFIFMHLMPLSLEWRFIAWTQIDLHIDEWMNDLIFYFSFAFAWETAICKLFGIYWFRRWHSPLCWWDFRSLLTLSSLKSIRSPLNSIFGDVAISATSSLSCFKFLAILMSKSSALLADDVVVVVVDALPVLLSSLVKLLNFVSPLGFELSPINSIVSYIRCVFTQFAWLSMNKSFAWFFFAYKLCSESSLLDCAASSLSSLCFGSIPSSDSFENSRMDAMPSNGLLLPSEFFVAIVIAEGNGSSLLPLSMDGKSWHKRQNSLSLRCDGASVLESIIQW